MTTTTIKIQPGQVAHFDFQADVYRGRYRFIAPVECLPSVWVCEYVEPTDAELDEILNDPSPYLDGEAEALRRIDRTGQRFEVRVVTEAQWAAAF